MLRNCFAKTFKPRPSQKSKFFFSKNLLKVDFNQFDAVFGKNFFFEICHKKKSKGGDPYQKIKNNFFFPLKSLKSV